MLHYLSVRFLFCFVFNLKKSFSNIITCIIDVRGAFCSGMYNDSTSRAFPIPQPAARHKVAPLPELPRTQCQLQGRRPGSQSQEQQLCTVFRHENNTKDMTQIPAFNYVVLMVSDAGGGLWFCSVGKSSFYEIVFVNCSLSP